MPIFVRCCFQAVEKRTRHGLRRWSSSSTSTASTTAMSLMGRSRANERGGVWGTGVGSTEPARSAGGGFAGAGAGTGVGSTEPARSAGGGFAGAGAGTGVGSTEPARSAGGGFAGAGAGTGTFPTFSRRRGQTQFLQDQSSLARTLVAERQGETWFPP